MHTMTCIEDLRQLAHRKVPRAFIDYAESGSYAEQTLHANRADLERIALRQRVLHDVGNRSTKTTILGEPAALPLALAYGGAAVGSLASGFVAARLLERGVSVNAVRKGVMLASALCVVPVPLALGSQAIWAAVAIMALALAGHQGFSTSLFGLIADVVPRNAVGRVTGFGSFCGNLGGIAIAKISGLVLAAGLGYAPLFGFACLSYLLALGWIQLMLGRICPVAEGGSVGG